MVSLVSKNVNPLADWNSWTRKLIDFGCRVAHFVGDVE